MGNGYGCQDNEAETLSKVFHSLKYVWAKKRVAWPRFLPASIQFLSAKWWLSSNRIVIMMGWNELIPGCLPVRLERRQGNTLAPPLPIHVPNALSSVKTNRGNEPSLFLVSARKCLTNVSKRDGKLLRLRGFTLMGLFCTFIDGKLHCCIVILARNEP